MDFELTKEQEAIKRFVREFCQKEVLPIADKIEKEDKIPDDLIKKLAQLKLFSIPYDKKYGGTGGGYLTSTLVLEELARACGSVAMLVGASYLASIPIDLFGTEEQKAKYIPRLCQGDGVGSLAFTEAATGSDPKAITTRATLEGDEYVLNGSKRFITGANLDGIIVLFARDGDGISAFIGEKNKPGYSTPKPWEKLGMHGIALNDIYLENYRVPAANLLGSAGNGYNILLDTIAIGKLDTSVLVLGCAQAALDEALKYAKERTVKGKPIAGFQTIQCLLADIAVQLEAARWLVYRLAALVDQGKDIRAESALTKIFVTEMGVEAVRKAFRVHGAYAYVTDFRIEKLLRDINIGEIVEGSNELQKVIVAHDLLK
ncbi:MAG: acyl-CoA dehydrogenase family protein [Dehalococcoidia bacterium]|jgi:alkylation response protein AidB-like acyl-CoA dehydrogenase